MCMCASQTECKTEKRGRVSEKTIKRYLQEKKINEGERIVGYSHRIIKTVQGNRHRTINKRCVRI